MGTSAEPGNQRVIQLLESESREKPEAMHSIRFECVRLSAVADSENERPAVVPNERKNVLLQQPRTHVSQIQLSWKSFTIGRMEF